MTLHFNKFNELCLGGVKLETIGGSKKLTASKHLSQSRQRGSQNCKMHNYYSRILLKFPWTWTSLTKGVVSTQFMQRLTTKLSTLTLRVVA